MYLPDDVSSLSFQFEGILKACLEVVDNFTPDDERTIAKIRMILLAYENNLLAKASQELNDKRDTIMRSLDNNDPETAAVLRQLFGS